MRGALAAWCAVFGHQYVWIPVHKKTQVKVKRCQRCGGMCWGVLPHEACIAFPHIKVIKLPTQQGAPR